MISEDFASEIISRWPYRSQRTDDELRAISADLSSFAYGKDSSVLESILAEFRKMKPPKGFGMWWFYQQVKSDCDLGVWWRICDNGHNYQNRGTCCPVCESYGFMLATGEAMPSDTVMIQPSCCQCSWYGESLSDPVFGLYGPSCNEYGTEQRGKQKGYCERCKCKGCCDMAYLYRNNPDHYRENYGEMIDGKFKAVLEILEKGKK